MRDDRVICVAGNPLLHRRCTRLPGCIRLRNDLCCVGWGTVKFCSLTLYRRGRKKLINRGLRHPTKNLSSYGCRHGCLVQRWTCLNIGVSEQTSLSMDIFVPVMLYSHIKQRPMSELAYMGGGRGGGSCPLCCAPCPVPRLPPVVVRKNYMCPFDHSRLLSQRKVYVKIHEMCQNTAKSCWIFFISSR